MQRPAIDFAAVPIDPTRLGRSLELRCDRLAPGQYRVSGGVQTHWVDLYTAAIPRCDCGDHLWRDQICKHILAALFREGDERVLTALRLFVQQLREVPRAA